LEETCEADWFEKTCKRNLDCPFAALFSVGSSKQGGMSLSVASAQARTRLHVYCLGPWAARVVGLHHVPREIRGVGSVGIIRIIVPVYSYDVWDGYAKRYVHRLRARHRGQRRGRDRLRPPVNGNPPVNIRGQRGGSKGRLFQFEKQDPGDHAGSRHSATGRRARPLPTAKLGLVRF
jgi:hypothetical protein